MKKIIVGFLLCMTAYYVQAQVKVKIGSALSQQPGTDVHLPVIAFGLNAANGGKPVSAMELHLTYASNITVYDTTLNFNALVPKAQWYFGANGSEYSCNWLEPTSGHISIPDSTVLFDLVFHYLGGQAEINFNTTTSILLDSAFEIIPNVIFVNGVITPSVGAGTSKWNGTGAWNTIANWSNGIPGDSTDAIIETGEVSILSNAVSRSLMVNAGCSTLVKPGYTLTVHTDFTNNGIFRILSDETGTGSFIAVRNISGTGQNNIERYLDFSNNTKHFISSPVQNAQASVFGGSIAEKYLEPTSAWEGLLASDNFQSGNGYRLSGTGSSAAAFTGTMNSQDVIVSGLPYTSSLSLAMRGLALVGNPYQSAIQWDKGSWGKNNLDHSIYIWDGYKYLSWNGSIGALTSGIIPSMQGFFVKSNAAGSSLTIPKSSRVHSQQAFHEMNGIPANVLTLRLEKSTDNLHFDETFINISAGSSNNFDAQFDAYKLFGIDTYPQVFTVASDGTELSVNTQPAFSNIPVVVKPGSSGAFKISFSNIETFNPGQPLFFEDKGSNTTIDIRNTNSYVFSSDGSVETGRFVMHFEVIGIEDHITSPFRVWMFDNRLNISARGNASAIDHLEVFNLSGQKISQTSQISVPSSTILDVPTRGLYILRIYTMDGVYSQKLFIE
ncbi:MAG: T9SS type A sorting domain-containing protein [bacterium]